LKRLSAYPPPIRFETPIRPIRRLSAAYPPYPPYPRIGRCAPAHRRRPHQDVRSLRDWAEARFERLETKLDARFDKLDARFHKVDARFDKVDARFERVDARLDAVTHTIAAAQVWAVLLYVALAAGTFGTMARAFGWL
jgi:hypothetical protein